MGLRANKANKTFVSINNCEFTVRCQEGQDGATPRKLKKGKNEGKTVYELRYSELAGYIKHIEYVVKDFGPVVEIEIDDGSDSFCLSFGWGNFNVRDSFIKRLPNVDLLQEVKFVVFRDKEKDNTVFLMKQNNEWVPMKYTKDHLNGMPEPKETVIRGEKKWDFSEVENFLFGVLEQQMERANSTERLPAAEEDYRDVVADCEEPPLPEEAPELDLNSSQPPF